jgi:hypothetical protein
MRTSNTTSTWFSFIGLCRAIRAGFDAASNAIGSACTAITGVVQAGYDLIMGALSSETTRCVGATAVVVVAVVGLVAVATVVDAFLLWSAVTLLGFSCTFGQAYLWTIGLLVALMLIAGAEQALIGSTARP